MKVTTTQPGALPAKLTDAYKDVIEQAQAEAQQMTRADFSMPFLGIVQSLSPQRDKSDPRYIEGAEEGNVFNTVTAELYKDGLEIIPVKYEFVFNVWRPRTQGSGFLGSFTTIEDATARAVENILAELTGYDPQSAAVLATTRGKEGWVKDTMNQYLVANGSPVLLSLTSTKLTPGRKWNTLISMEKPTAGRVPVRWNKVWRLTTVKQKNDDGTFYNVQVPRSVRETNQAEWEQAANFYSMLKSGLVKVEYEKSDDAPTATVVEDAGPSM